MVSGPLSVEQVPDASSRNPSVPDGTRADANARPTEVTSLLRPEGTPQEQGGRPDNTIKSVFRTVVGTVIALALPLLLIGANLDMLTNSGWLYSYNWWRNGIPETTGIERPELNRAATQIKAYFATAQSEELLDVRVKAGQREQSLYNDREVLHMRDVKTLVRGFWSAAEWSGAAMVIMVVAGLFVVGRRRFWDLFATAVRWSAVGSLAAVAVLAVAALINFGALFNLFHVLSFANDLWQLSSYTDYLLIMFPERFWLESTLLLGGLIVAEYAALWLLTNRLLRRAPG